MYIEPMNTYEIITDRIVKAMEESKSVPWHKPWSSFRYGNCISKKAYRGVNVLMCAIADKGEWFLTFNQARAAGGSIKKGAKGIPVVFWKMLKEQKVGPTGNKEEKTIPLLRYYTVFALEDTENVKVKLPAQNRLDFMPIEEAEKLVLATGVNVIHSGDRACYRPSEHTVYMPLKEKFGSVEEYYCTLFHELTHWLSKEVGVTLDCNFGNESYSKEELTAEIGANFFASYCGIDISKTIKNSGAYLNNWISQLRDDCKLIVGASGQAQKRFEWVMEKLNPKAEEPTEELDVEAVAA